MKDLQKKILDTALEVLAKENNTTREDILTEVAKGNENVSRNILRVCVETQKMLSREV